MIPPQAKKILSVPHFLFVRRRFPSPRLSLSSKELLKLLLIRGVRNAETKKKQSRNNSAAIKQSPGSPSKDTHENLIYILESSCKN